jgi:hypothetical protein
MRALRIPILVACAWAVLVLIFETVKPADRPEMTLCVFRNVTDCPCPTCGATRAVAAFCAGRPT